MDKDYSKEFKKCPVCGSEEVFFATLGEEAKAASLIRPETSACFDRKIGVFVDKLKLQLGGIKPGTEIPGYDITLDICTGCGMMRATKLQRRSDKFSGIEVAGKEKSGGK
jgi:hypothetical protein